MLEREEHVFCFGSVGVDGNNLDGIERQIGAHQDVAAIPIHDGHETDQATDGLPEEVNIHIVNGSHFSIGLYPDLLEPIETCEQLHQGDFVLFPVFFQGLRHVQEPNGIVLGPGNHMDQLLALFAEGFLHYEEGRTNSIVGIQCDITAPARLPGLLHDHPSYAGDQGGRLSIQSLARIEIANALLQLALERDGERLFYRAHKNCNKAEVMAHDVLRLAAIFRILMKGLDRRHLLCLFGNFCGVRYEQEPSVEFHEGELTVTTEEPDERKVHVRICGGSAGKPVLLPGDCPGSEPLVGFLR